MRKETHILVNGIILALVGVFLAVYFSANAMWGIAQVFIILLLAGLSALQLVIRFKFLGEPKLGEPKNDENKKK